MNNEPLCGQDWYQKHRLDHTQADIDSLTIVVACDGRDLPPVKQDHKDRGIVKNLVKSYRKEKGERNNLILDGG